MDLHQLGGKIYITKGQLGTLQCIAQTQKWTYTARKLLAMVYPDDFLKGRCAVGKKGSSNSPLDQEDLGIMKGNCNNIIQGVIPGWWVGLGGCSPPTFGQQHFFRGFHTPLTERYHQKWC